MTTTTGHKRSQNSVKWAYRLTSLLLLAIVWEILGRTMNSLLMPTFLETMAGLGELLLDPALWDALWVSNQAMLIGFFMAAVVGIPIGILMGRWRTAEKFLDIYLNIMLVTPISALIPLFIIAIGLGLASRVMVVFVFAVVIIAVNTRTGLRTLDPALSEMARAFGATERQMWTKILFPGALPAMMSGLRLGFGRAITGMVIVELLLVAVGVGRLLLRFQGNWQPGLVYAVIIVVLAEAVLLMEALKRLESRLVPWENEVAVG